jgi:hypothetical protein
LGVYLVSTDKSAHRVFSHGFSQGLTMSFNKNSDARSLPTKIADYRADLGERVLFTEQDRAQKNVKKREIEQFNDLL